ncbi:hypothetical protein [Thalassomonas actiniarum]|uniref:DUF2490 domain-containing protein n=1 Tax=Thalassomonas actiniarum TaxID=485447 RepID=A0AAE9YLZ3_9GAMM|nr:hypothetical protein [Thalassomonas actiniarum]WDD97804.1 hypothetical protein SG35_021255 [Thalassomonas actiniarum]
MKTLLLSGFCFVCFFATAQVSAQSKNTRGGFLDFNLYPHLTDVDTDSVFTLNAAAKLGQRFSYFSLLNLYSQEGSDSLGDADAFYTEQNIRWQIRENSPLDLTLQMNLRTGEDNDRHRLGIRWRLSDTSFLQAFFKSIHLRYAINLHAVQFDHEDPYIWQLEHSFMMKFPYISNRLYLAGFADHIFNQDLPSTIPANPVVLEAQLGYRLVENFFIVSEYRLNQYRRSDVNNLAIGLQYKFIW